MSVCLAVVFYGFFIEPYRVAIHTISLRDGWRIPSLKDKVAIHLTDLHIHKMGKYEKHVLDIVAQIKPDFIFLTGDYVAWDGDYGPALAFLAKLEARYGIYGVLGDYDRNHARQSCLFCHGNTNYHECVPDHDILFLRNRVVCAPVVNGDVTIAGIDGNDESIQKIMEKIRADCPDIVLCHNPLVFDDIPSECDVLVLSGDTHGGQVWLPSWIWKFVGYEKNAKYSYGIFTQGHKKMIVSKGIGTSHLPFRLFCAPEILVYYF